MFHYECCMRQIYLSMSIQMEKCISSIILYPEYAPADLRYFSCLSTGYNVCYIIFYLNCFVQAKINAKKQSIVAHEPNYHIASVFIA